MKKIKYIIPAALICFCVIATVALNQLFVVHDTYSYKANEYWLDITFSDLTYTRSGSLETSYVIDDYGFYTVMVHTLTLKPLTPYNINTSIERLNVFSVRDAYRVYYSYTAILYQVLFGVMGLAGLVILGLFIKFDVSKLFNKKPDDEIYRYQLLRIMRDKGASEQELNEITEGFCRKARGNMSPEELADKLME